MFNSGEAGKTVTIYDGNNGAVGNNGAQGNKGQDSAKGNDGQKGNDATPRHKGGSPRKCGGGCSQNGKGGMKGWDGNKGNDGGWGHKGADRNKGAYNFGNNISTNFDIATGNATGRSLSVCGFTDTN